MQDPQRRTRVDVRLKQAVESGSLPRELLVCGPAGTGKTFAILALLHTIAADYPDLRILICRQTRVSLTDSVLVTFEQEILPADGMEHLAAGTSRKYRSSYQYPGGSEIVLGGLDDPMRIGSSAWDFIFLNESIQLQEDAWETLGSRLNRPGRPRWGGYLIGDTNPGDPSHWLKRRCDASRTALWDTCHEANPALHDGRNWTEDGALYMDRLDRLQGTRRRRLKEGLWAAGEGQWFETFTDSHVSEQAEFHPAFPVYLAVDSGVHTGAVLFQVREIGGEVLVTVFGDYYAFNRPAHDAAKDLLALLVKLCRGRFDRGTMDPSSEASVATAGPTVANEFRRARLYLENWPKFPGSVVDGLALIDSFVAVSPPALLVHPRCTGMIEAFANYRRAKKGRQWIDRPEDPQHPHEELMDALRGGLQDRFPEGRRPEPRLIRVPARSVF